MIIEAAKKFEQGKYLDAIYNCRLKKEDILGIAEYVKEYKARLSREHLALAKFALTFNNEYATENNKCFDSAEKLFGKIRSTICSSKRIYKRFCRTVRKRSPPAAPLGPSVFKRSELVNDYFSEQFFGIETYDECVKNLYEQLEDFFIELLKCLALCRMIIMEESTIRHSPERCMNIYRDCYDKMVNNSRMMVRAFKECKMVPNSEFEERKKNAVSLRDFICSNYHMYDLSQFQMHVVVSELRKDGSMTDVEKILFGPNNKEFAEKAKLVIQHFDELENNAHKGKHKNKHSAYCVASFMLWCGVGITLDDKVKMFVEDYFNNTYKGEYPPAKTNAVNSAKNILLYSPKESNLDNINFHEKIDTLVEQYTPKDNILRKSVANY